MKKILSMLLMLSLALMPTLGACAGAEDNPTVTIEMENGGVIVLELYPAVAPNTVANFISLASSGFYDGLTFHRVIAGFMVQGGDPLGNGTGGPGYGIRGEFQANGFANSLKHERGVISMARARSYDSAGSQFFIMHADAPHLDGAYAAFGKVVSGMDVVDEIATTATDNSDRPLSEQKIRTVTVDTKGREYQLVKVSDLYAHKDTNPVATITMANGGVIELELFPECAPNTVANFISLANAGFYDGLIFHRVIAGFMIQGGDPLGNGMGGPGYAIRGEFAANGAYNPLSHARGVISMARSQRMDSAGSQFFIMHAAASYLDGNYAAFGAVLSGMEVVDEIAAAATDANDRPLSEQKIQTITVDTKGIEYPLEKIGG